MVDFRTPTTATQMQSTRKSPNHKGQISSPFLFEFGGFSSNNLSEQQRKLSETDSEVLSASNLGPGGSTTVNAVEGIFDNGCASPSLSSLGSGKPSLAPPSGPSKPRLVKVRKHLGSHQVRSTPLSNSGFNPSFNLFRPGSESLDQIDKHSKMRDLSDQWFSCKSFSPDSAHKSGGADTFVDSNYIDPNFGKSGDVGFIFEANQSNSVSNPNVEKSVEKSLPDEMRELNIGSELEPRNVKDTAFSFNAGGRESSNSDETSDLGVFVFRSGSKKSSDFDGNKVSNLPVEMRKLNIEGFRNGDGAKKSEGANLSTKANDENNLVFGRSDNVASVLVGNMTSKLLDEMKGLNKEDSGNVDDEKKFIAEDKNTFVLGSGNSNAGSFDRSTSTMLPDEMKKLNIEGSGKGDSVEKNSNNIFFFGSSKNSSSSFGGGTENMQPDEMRKLNIGSRLGDSSGNTNMGSSSSREFVKETQHDPAVGNTIPTPFIFQAGQQGKSLCGDQVPSFQSNDENDIKLGGASVSSSLFSSIGSGFQSAGNVFEMPSTDRAENKGGFSFTSTPDGSRTPYTDLRTPKQDTACSSTGNLFSELNQKLEFRFQRGASKDTKLKKKKGKLRLPALVNCLSGQDYVLRENSSQENPESPGFYSPMDYSPYQETLAGDQCSRETSVGLDESFQLDNNCASADAHRIVCTNLTAEGLLAAKQHLDINEDDPKSEELNEEGVGNHFEQNSGLDPPLDEFVSVSETECFRSKTEKAEDDSDASAAAIETDANLGSNIERQESDVSTPFSFASISEDAGETNFTFAASSSTRDHLSAPKRHYRKKNRMKVGQDLYSSILNAKIQMAAPSVQFSPLASSSLFPGPGLGQKEDLSFSQGKVEIRSEVDKEPEINQASISTAAVSTAAQESCEKWRLRGNQAYANGHLSKAEDYYTHGMNCVSPNELSQSCLRALVLCYSNRAATRMSLGRMREALEDCKTASTIDPTFFRVQLRAANCHLALGEIEDAAKYFQKCLQSGSDVCLDRKLIIEASDGLQKAQQVAEHMEHSAELVQQRTSTDAENALQIIAKGLSLSPYSEKLVEMKAEALFMLRKYEEVIQLCEQSLDSAEKNSVAVSSDGQLENMDSSEGIRNSPVGLWRWYLISKSHFYLGRLEEALALLEKQEQAGTITEKYGSKTLKSLISITATVRALLCHKAAGNEAFQLGRHSEAVEHYTAALSCNVESRPFAAVCICNRAAAYQALGQITDAIADCSLATALDGNYTKAISRRATLHEMIRDYGQARDDLQRLISLLGKQSEENTTFSGALGRSTSSLNDLRQAQLRLSTMEEEAKKGIPLDMYLILGIEPTGTASDVKKAYRKAALRHHPDKAGQFLARSENGDDGLWKEIAEEVHRDADRLFKMIGEAYAVLSDHTKRSCYDSEEEMRNSRKRANGSGTSRTPADRQNYPFGRTSSRRQWRKVWKSYGDPNSP